MHLLPTTEGSQTLRRFVLTVILLASSAVKAETNGDFAVIYRVIEGREAEFKEHTHLANPAGQWFFLQNKSTDESEENKFYQLRKNGDAPEKAFWIPSSVVRNLMEKVEVPVASVVPPEQRVGASANSPQGISDDRPAIRRVDPIAIPLREKHAADENDPIAIRRPTKEPETETPLGSRESFPNDPVAIRRPLSEVDASTGTREEASSATAVADQPNAVERAVVTVKRGFELAEKGFAYLKDRVNSTKAAGKGADTTADPFEGAPDLHLTGRYAEISEQLGGKFAPWSTRLSVRIVEDITTTEGEVIKAGKETTFWEIGSQLMGDRDGPVVLASIDDGGADFGKTLFAVDREQYKDKIVRHEPVSLLLQDFEAEGGYKIPAGTHVYETSNGGDWVSVGILGDVTETEYRLPRKLFVDQKATQLMKKNGKSVDRESWEASFVEKGERIPVHSLAKSLAIVPIGGVEGRDEIVLQPGEQLEDLGPYNVWARRVRIAGDSKEYYIGERTLHDAIDSTNYSSFSEIPEIMPVEQKQFRREGHIGLHEIMPGRQIESGYKEGELYQGFSIDTETTSIDCEKRNDKYHKEKQIPKRSEFRKKLQKSIVDSVNESLANGAQINVHPAIFEASVIIESDMRPLLENTDEKARFRNEDGSYRDPGNESDVWGKGACQFGPAYAKATGFDWGAPKPSMATIMTYSKDHPKSVWNPFACLAAKVEKWSSSVNKDTQGFRFPNPRNVEEIIDLKDFMFGRGSPENPNTIEYAQTLRNLIGYFNRGSRVPHAIESYLLHHGKLPANYGQAFNAPKHPDNKKSVLNAQRINRGHVWRAVGLCGGIRKGSLMDRLMNDYVFVGGRWRLAADWENRT